MTGLQLQVPDHKAAVTLQGPLLEGMGWCWTLMTRTTIRMVMATPENRAVTGLGRMMPAAAGSVGPREETSTAAEEVAEIITAAEGTETIGIKRRGVKGQREVRITGSMTWRLGTAQRQAMTETVIGKGTMH